MKVSLKNYKIYVIIYTCLIIISCSIVTYTKISFDKSEIEFNNKKNSYENKLIYESINDILQISI